MKVLISIILISLIALFLSGCVIVGGSYSFGHRHHGGVIVTNVPPPPAIIVRPGPMPPPGYPYHREAPRHGDGRYYRR